MIDCFEPFAEKVRAPERSGRDPQGVAQQLNSFRKLVWIYDNITVYF
jgi:hypothetical protein